MLGLAMLWLSSSALGATVQTDCSRTELTDALRSHYDDQLRVDDDVVEVKDVFRLTLIGESDVVVDGDYQALPQAVRKQCKAAQNLLLLGQLGTGPDAQLVAAPIADEVPSWSYEWHQGPGGVVTYRLGEATDPMDYRDDFEASIIRVVPAIEKCVAKAVKKRAKAEKDPLVPADVRLKIGVDTSGAVVRMERVNAGYDGQELADCMERRVSKARLPYAQMGRYTAFVMMQTLGSSCCGGGVCACKDK